MGEIKSVARVLLKTVRIHGASFILDLIVIFATAAWWTGIFQWFRFYHYLILVGLMQWERFYRFPLIRGMFALLTVLFASFTALSFFPMYCVSLSMLVVAVVSIPVCFILLVKYRGFTVRSAARSFIPAFILGVVVVGSANNTCSDKECAAARSDSGLEVLLDLPMQPLPRGIPRFLVLRPEKNDVIVVYRTPSKPIGHLSSADRLDLETRSAHPITEIKDEPIGLYFHRPTSQILIVTANKFNHKHPKTIAVLNSDLRVTRVLDFPGGEDDDYTAHMMPYGDKVAIRAEDEGLYLFDPVTYDLKNIDPKSFDDLKRCRLFAEPGFLQAAPDGFYLAGGIDPLIFEITRAHSVCYYNFQKKRFVYSYRSNIPGAMDMAYVPDRDEILVSSVWRDVIWVLSARDLKYKRSLHIGPCVRPVGYDPVKKIGYTVECFSGNLVSFDVVTGRVEDKRFVGRNARKIYYIDGLGIVVLSGCGVIRVL